MSTRQYIGARYVPLIDGEYDATKDYEPLTVVLSDDGNSYTSKTYVPAGTPLTNSTYWVLTGEYNAQVAMYHSQVEEYKADVDLMRSFINALAEGIDNTGLTAVASDINDLIASHRGSRIYFPAGKYLLNEPLVIPSNGVMLVCDSEAEFFTNSSMSYLIKIGSGTTPDNLLKMGIIGGVWNGENTTECTIFCNNVEYQAVLTDVYVKDFTVCGIKIGTNQDTSTQTYMQNINILAKHGDGIEPTATGLIINGTDNYCNIVNIGHCKKGVVLNGSGNLLSNIHTWWGTALNELVNITREKLYECRAIENSGNNRIVNLHMDNPYIGIFLTPYNNHLTVRNVVFNYGTLIDHITEYDWDACMLYYNDYSGNNRSSYDISGICVTGIREVHNIKSIRGQLYDTINVCNPNLNRFEYYGQPQLVSTLPLEDEINNITRYSSNYPFTTEYQGSVAAGYYKIGYIQKRNSFAKLRIACNRNGGCIELSIQITNDTITVCAGRLKRIPDHLSIIVGDTAETINGYDYFPIYLRKFSTGNYYCPLFVSVLNAANANIFFRRRYTFDTVIADAPSGTEIDLYTLNSVKYATLDTEGDTIDANNTKDYTVNLTVNDLEHFASIVGFHCGNTNLILSVLGSTENTVSIRIHNDQGTAQSVGTVQVDYMTELN